jgi:hypothetical protein
MDSLQLSELQTFFSHNKGELTSKKLFVESIDCAPLDLLDPILERALDLSEYISSTTPSSLDRHIISTHVSSDPTVHQSLPQVVLDATTLVHEEKYPGEGSVLPPPVVNFLEPSQSPAQSDVTSYYSEDSNPPTQQMPEFSQLASPGVDAPSTSSFQWPARFGQVKHEDYSLKNDHDFGYTPCQIATSRPHHSSVSSSIGGDCASLPYVTSPTTSLPSPTSTIYSASSPGTPGPSTPNGRGRRPHGSTAPYSIKSRRRQVEKGTVEYVEKRARNNVAVRKSRAKAKEKARETETRVSSLVEQNENLQKKVDLLTKELNVLKGLFLNVGASIPDEFLKLVGDS